MKQQTYKLVKII